MFLLLLGLGQAGLHFSLCQSTSHWNRGDPPPHPTPHFLKLTLFCMSHFAQDIKMERNGFSIYTCASIFLERTSMR